MKTDNTVDMKFDTDGCYDLIVDSSQAMVTLNIGTDLQGSPFNHASQFYSLTTTPEASDIMESESSPISDFISLQDGFTSSTCGIPLDPYSVSDITISINEVHTETFTLPTLCSGQTLSIEFADQVTISAPLSEAS